MDVKGGVIIVGCLFNIVVAGGNTALSWTTCNKILITWDKSCVENDVLLSVSKQSPLIVELFKEGGSPVEKHIRPG